MNLRPDFTRDLGFLDFKRAVAHEAALEFIFNLGARCHLMRKTTLVIPDRQFGDALGLPLAVDPAVAKEALIRNGMIRALPAPDTYEICVFSENNAGLLAMWRNGNLGGRRKQAKPDEHKVAERAPLHEPKQQAHEDDGDVPF